LQNKHNVGLAPNVAAFTIVIVFSGYIKSPVKVKENALWVKQEYKSAQSLPVHNLLYQVPGSFYLVI
jgi:hypothetical protein